jgi:HEAT repeat protein
LLSSPELLANLPGEARAVAGDAIVRLAEPGLVTLLVALVDSGDPELAELGARALGRTRSRHAIPTLLRLFEDDSLAVHAYRSLVSLAVSWPAEVREALTPLMSGELRPHEVRAWAEVTGEESVNVIRRALHGDDDTLRAAAAEASLFAPSETLTTLRAALMDEAAIVRRAAARAAGHLSALEATALLQRALLDADASVLALACTSAGASGSVPSAPRLVELTQHADPAVIVAAIESLALLGQLSDDVLVKASTHSSGEVAKLAFLLGADRPVLVTQAHAALSHSRWDVRVAAARLLAVSGTREALAELLDAVARESDAVARGLLNEAAEALSRRV